ncbi:PrsW family glutamic-type intramembrane protease [Nocardia sp. CDC160]|uniref:PrsW family glutamic-type intramembrane protease n=1 Tax=Nocardia sp. CDC160 TaxID=3112166 RepID=UPI002DBB15F9|nr:PrsW family glutamic-type intramembrane protease [Nocardia sp. CDC160]MEC3919092.1 PrsW family glutamic-type intramembrane protease [Nocardia sp. CDC160]
MSWFQPRSLLFWVYCLAVMIGPLLFLLQAAGQVWFAGVPALAALPITAVTLLIIGRILFALDPFRARRHLVAPMVMGAIWGATVWTGLAMWANDHLSRAITNAFGDRFAISWSAAITAPIDEEYIKAIGIAVVALLFRARLTRPMHGLLLGASVGLGAQIAEDCLYSTQTALSSPQDPVVDVLLVAVLRLITALTSHWAMSALAGVGIVVLLIRTDRSWGWRLGVFALFYALAFTMHFLFDAPRPPGPALLSTYLPILIDLLIFAIAYAWVLTTERRWFRDLIARPQARAVGTEAGLAPLLTYHRRRKARAALRHSTGWTRKQAARYERGLLDRVVDLDLAPPQQTFFPQGFGPGPGGVPDGAGAHFRW